jgi:hypothetical protein
MNMKNLAHEEEYKGCKIELEYDDHPESPREWSNVGTMVCWHRRYDLGDEQPKCSPEEWFLNQVQGGHRWNEEKAKREQAIRDEQAQVVADPELDDALDRVERSMEDDTELCRELFEKDNIILPLYLYDHSGISMSTGSFSCPWDSGQVGFIYCSVADARKEWPSASDAEVRKEAEKYLKFEVETYDNFLTGQVVGFVALDPAGEVIESCHGFYPDDREGYGKRWDYPISQAREVIDAWHEKQEAEAVERAHWEARDTTTT